MSAGVEETVVRLLLADVAGADRSLVQSVVGGIGEVRAWLDSLEVRCARRIRELAAEGSSGPPEALLRNGGRRSGREAAAAAERERVCSQLSGFEAALAAGEVSSGHVDALSRATKGLDEETVAELGGHEETLLAAAGREGVEAFDRTVRDLARWLTAQTSTSDAEELDRQRAASKVKRWTDKVTGMCHTHLELDPLRDHAMWNALERQLAKARQRPEHKQRPWQQVQVDTIVETITTGAAAFSAADAADGEDTADGAGGTGPSADPHPNAPGGSTSVGVHQRVPEAMVLVDLDTLVEGLHEYSVCELDDGTPVPVSTMRRLLCDCEVLPAVLNGAGEVRDVGRSKRTATRGQRRMLRAMHRTCAHPDCTVPFSVCRIHHIRWWWRDRGRTDIDNLVPLCEAHHHLVHEGGWGLTMTPDRVASWFRPDGSHHHTGPTIDRAPHGVARPKKPPGDVP